MRVEEEDMVQYRAVLDAIKIKYNLGDQKVFIDPETGEILNTATLGMHLMPGGDIRERIEREMKIKREEIEKKVAKIREDADRMRADAEKQRTQIEEDAERNKEKYRGDRQLDKIMADGPKLVVPSLFNKTNEKEN